MECSPRELDDDRFLQRFEDWSQEWANEEAELEGLTLDETAWDIIKILRDYFGKFDDLPINRALYSELGKIWSIDKKEASKRLYSTFPKGPQVQAHRLAGLPKRRRCCL